MIGGRIVAPEQVESQYAHISTEYKFSFYRQPGFRNGSFDTHADSPDEAVRQGVVRTLQHAQFEGIDPIMARALYRAGIVSVNVVEIAGGTEAVTVRRLRV